MTNFSHQARVEAAIADPTKVSASPMAVVDDGSLESDEKLAILRSWVKDTELISAAQSENMAGGEEAQVHEVRMALAKLQANTGESR